jgi:hypothetical protein
MNGNIVWTSPLVDRAAVAPNHDSQGERLLRADA